MLLLGRLRNDSKHFANIVAHDIDLLWVSTIDDIRARNLVGFASLTASDDKFHVSQAFYLSPFAVRESNQPSGLSIKRIQSQVVF